MNGTTQVVEINSEPSGVHVLINDQPMGKTPVVTELPRKRDHHIKYQLDEETVHEDFANRNLSKTVLLNLALSPYGLAGIPVDFISGGAYYLDKDSFHIDLSYHLKSGSPLIDNNPNSPLREYNISSAHNHVSKQNKDLIYVPPLKAGRIAGELSFGFLSGLGGTLAGLLGAILYEEISDGGGHGSFDAYDMLFIGAISGYAVGTSIGVSLIGSCGNEKGSFIASLCGSLAGTLISAAIITAIESNPYEPVPEWAPLAVISAPVIGATIGFNLSRKYRKPLTCHYPHGNFADPAGYFR